MKESMARIYWTSSAFPYRPRHAGFITVGHGGSSAGSYHDDDDDGDDKEDDDNAMLIQGLAGANK